MNRLNKIKKFLNNTKGLLKGVAYEKTNYLVLYNKISIEHSFLLFLLMKFTLILLKNRFMHILNDFILSLNFTEQYIYSNL